MQKIRDSKYIYIINNISSWSVFILSAAVYLLTIDHSASYWDCPEYVTCASRLEVGHPPGNPVWMLAMRFATMPFPPHMHAPVVNACSALLMAFAAFFLARIAFAIALYLGTRLSSGHRAGNFTSRILPAVCAFSAGTCFAFSDSAWFSAAEAEVYAMSTFLSALSVWLMVKWAHATSAKKRNRLLILVAYITGLSLGVHQLNLLCIPVFAIIFVFKMNSRHATWKAWTAIFISFAIVGLILTGMMQGSLSWAKRLELLAVNIMHLPYFSGVLAYILLLIVLFPLADFAIRRGGRITMAICLCICFWCSGFFVFGNSLLAGGLLSAIAAAVMVFIIRLSRPAATTLGWCIAFLLLGFSSFALILIRGHAAPPMNEAAPTDIFALSSYIARDQYGSRPLFYGATPYSKPVMHEEWDSGDSLPHYFRYALKKTGITYAPVIPDAHLHHRSRMLSHSDSVANENVARNGKGYLISDYTFSRITTPELDMFLPRITSNSPYDIESYDDWAGMNKESMTKVKISEAVDSSGNYVGKMLADGQREEKYSWRPTYMQNLKMFVSYQIYYMYLRYLLWNFIGRQNDIHSTGEIEHGNFITGVPLIDNAMLGDQSLLPGYAGKENPGRNVYFGIPFILGIVGIIHLFRSGAKGRRIHAVIFLMFLMTGLAIVVYLNQAPGEARERDYSFLVSFMAFCLWIGLGVVSVITKLWRLRVSPKVKAVLATIVTLAAPGILLAENYDDHQRRGRSEPLDFAGNILEMERPSIIFSHGDNDTFPLWYARQTEGVGRQHTIIDISYLATPSYVVNLMKQGKESIRFTAKPSDIAYGALSFTRIAPDADTIPVPLIDALKGLYAKKEGEPILRHCRVTIPGKTFADTLIVNLRDLASGGTLIPFRTLMLLDIIASNNDSPTPKPLHFLHPVKRDFYKAVLPAVREGVYSYIYDPPTPDSLWAKELNSMLSIPLKKLDTKFQRPYYSDPVILDKFRRQRGSLVIAARRLLNEGDTARVSAVAGQICRHYPYSRIPAGSFTVADTTFHEGLGFGRLLLDTYRKTGNLLFLEAAQRHTETAISQANDWYRYYRSLSPRQRAAVSSSTLRILSSLPKLKSLKAEILSAAP